MIKFWKSAAKGKSGCPVRPPEPSTTTSCASEIRSLIEIQTINENEDFTHLFEKKSKLSITLHDIMVERKALKYFMAFMEMIGKQSLVTCWLELDEFKALLSKTSNLDEKAINSKLNRTKSFDLNCKCRSEMSQRFSWRETSMAQSLDDDPNMGKSGSTSSCSNLANQIDKCEMHERSFSSNPTEEAIKLFKKYVALEAPHRLDVPDTFRKSVITNICQPEGHIKKDCFQPVQDIIYNQIETNHYNDFINSHFYIKAQIDILTYGSLNLEDILYCETILFYFTEYLEQEGCRVLLEFMMAVMHFRDHNLENNTKTDQVQADAIVIYDKHISLQATSPVGFPTEIRLQVESDICLEEGPLPTCFDLPYKIVFKTLSQYVRTFLQSELYYKYISEMIHSVEQISSNNKSLSDCSSEFSISTQNTLLAMGDPVFRKKKRNHSVPDMTIDSNQLYNADALWQRKKQEGLSLGRVNSLGRFESKFEPDPDKKDKSVLKKMVSRFVPTTTSKVEEEMAWQIAHMIVKDITDLTMAPPGTENDN